MTSSINFSVNNSRVSAAPGASSELAVTVQNLTTLLDQVEIVLKGIDASWVQVIPPQVPVFAQGEASARVIVTPPNDMAASVAGVYPIQVTGVSHENPGQEGQTAAELEVQLVGDYQLRVEGGGPAGGQEASYPIAVKNGANAPLQVRFSGSDPGSALWYKFEPFQLLVPAGGDGAAKLTARAKSGPPGNRGVTFTLAAQGEYLLKGGSQTGAPAHQLSGQFAVAAPSPLSLTLRAVSTKDNSAGAFQVIVGNPNSAPITVRLTGEAKNAGLSLEFAPPELLLAAQGSGRSMLVVHPTIPGTGGSVQVSAQPVDGNIPPVSAEATWTPAAVPAGPTPMSLWLILLIILLGFVVMAVLLLILFSALGLFR